MRKVRIWSLVAGGALGKVAGFASGHTQPARVYGNPSASFSPTAGFTNGQLGGSGGGAIALVPGDCRPQEAQEAKLTVKGVVVSATSTSLVVMSGGDQVACAVSAAQAADVAELEAGDSVTATCLLSGGTYQLLALGKRGERDRR